MAKNQICWVTDIKFEGCMTHLLILFKSILIEQLQNKMVAVVQIPTIDFTYKSEFDSNKTFWKLCRGLHHAGLFRWREPSPPDGSKMKSFENTSGSQTEPPTDETSCIIHVNKNSLLNLVEPRKFILSMCFCCQVRSIWSSSSQRIRRVCSLQRERAGFF